MIHTIGDNTIETSAFFSRHGMYPLQVVFCLYDTQALAVFDKALNRIVQSQS